MEVRSGDQLSEGSCRLVFLRREGSRLTVSKELRHVVDPKVKEHIVEH